MQADPDPKETGGKSQRSLALAKCCSPLPQYIWVGGSQATDLPGCHETRSFYCRLRRSSPLRHIRDRNNPNYVLDPHFSEVHFYISIKLIPVSSN
jgi:hypothetical protein